MEEFINYLKTQYRYKEQTLQMKIRELNSWKSLCTKHQKLDKLTTSEILQMVEIKKNSYQNQVINRHLQTLEDYY
jgi:site-specific recombinase XerD